jgi:hypothetical protein
MDISEIVADFAAGLSAADARRPVFKTYKPGIGPHDEDVAVRLALDEMRASKPTKYGNGRSGQQLLYPGSKQRVDVWLGDPREWVIEVKMARFFRNNGDHEGTGIKDILSPFECDRSALTDTTKLAGSSFPHRKALLIYGFDYATKPLAVIMDAFQVLARERVQLLGSAVTPLGNLVHPVHARGAVYGWEIDPLR